jgi:hypothetical protein
MGTSSAAVAYREKRARAAKATRAAGSIVPVAAGSAAQISQSLLGYAVGRLFGLAERIARENNLPEMEFTRRAAALFAELSVR